VSDNVMSFRNKKAMCHCQPW